ncbi:LptM family lipoprotein [Neobacillus vireti]|uniref:LptM family lipoprotein n=1 Tax=Neobacillus vireti TaxID=220686 RepID=UPI002FFD8EAB
MKKYLLSLLALFMIFSLAACSSESSSNAKKEGKSEEESAGSKEAAKVLTKDEFYKMFSDPKKYKRSKVEFYAKIFIEPEKDEDGTYLQAYADNNMDRNIIIAIADPNLDVKTDDIIFVSGVVKDVFKGENALGGTVTAPVITADKIELSDYATAFAPALKTVEVNKDINQHGYVLHLGKIEIAESETRLHVSITNNSDRNISFYSFNSKIVSGNQQLETQDNYDAGYTEVQSEILPGVKSEGIVVFPKVPETGTLKIMFEGSSEKYELDFQPFQFDVTY